MSNKYKHLMLDIETMGTESFSSIISIGAVEFDMESGNSGSEFYVNVDLQSCMDIGLEVQASTIMWWLKQSEAARNSFFEKQNVDIMSALLQFSDFFLSDYELWGNSARFDIGIMQNACELPIH